MGVQRGGVGGMGMGGGDGRGPPTIPPPSVDYGTPPPPHTQNGVCLSVHCRSRSLTEPTAVQRTGVRSQNHNQRTHARWSTMVMCTSRHGALNEQNLIQKTWVFF